MKMFVTLSAMVLAGAAVSGDAAPVNAVAKDILDSDVDIAIGRLEAINEHTAEIWQKMREDAAAESRHDLRRLNSALRRTVWEYNRLREDLCADRFIVEESCGQPYLPGWVHDSKKMATTLKELEARQDDLAGQVVKLWDAACARLEKATSYEDSRPYCSIE
jgi:hypothetical protein